MSKRRKVRWIVGGFLFLLVGFAVAVTVMTNTPDARMERVLAKIIDEYGFEKTDEYLLNLSTYDEEGFSVTENYSASRLKEGSFEKLVERLSEVCDGCKVTHIEQVPMGVNGGPYTWIEPTTQYGSILGISVVVAEDESHLSSESASHLILVIERRVREQGFMNWIRSWLPW